MGNKSSKTSPRDKFFSVAERLGWEDGGLCAEPWPDWFTKVVLRFARLFAPELKLQDFKNNPQHFYGILTGVFMDLCKSVDELNLAEWPPHPLLDTLKAQLLKGRTVEFPKVKQTLKAALALPQGSAQEFFAGFAKSSSGQLTHSVLDRLVDGVSLQICFFLLSQRWVIERKEVSSVTALWRRFAELKNGDEPNWNPESEVGRSWQAQFRKISSESGIKLAPRGRPSKKHADAVSAANPKKAPKKAGGKNVPKRRVRK